MGAATSTGNMAVVSTGNGTFTTANINSINAARNAQASLNNIARSLISSGGTGVAAKAASLTNQVGNQIVGFTYE